MNKLLVVLALATVPFFVSAQKTWEVETYGGITGYSGDLTQPAFSFRSLGPGVNLNLKYEYRPQILLRGGIGWGTIAAYDKNNKDIFLKARNLSFKSTLLELNFCVEINLIDPYEPYEMKTLPYIFGGVGLFHFNPYASDNSGQKVFLHPLSTEGEGLAEFPDRKPYHLTQLCLPFGLGVRKKISSRSQLGLEIGFRKTFTDYLDDVSKTYVDKDLLLIRKGAKSAEMSERSISGNGYPPKAGAGDTRGNPGRKDLYYAIGLKLTVKLGGKVKKEEKKEK